MKPIDLKEETPCSTPAAEGASVRRKLGVNRAAALGLAVMLSLSGTLMGCVHQPTEEEEEEEDESSYSSSGGHYYHSGGSFYGGSWSKSSDSGGAKSYTSTKSGGSIGG